MAVRTLAHIAKAPKAQPAARIQAANSLLDRGWGKAIQPTENKHSGTVNLMVKRFGYRDSPSGE